MKSSQAVNGLIVKDIQIKKAKDSEKLKLILEANVEDVTAGELDFGEVVKALWSHQASDTDIGFSVLVDKKE